MDQTPTTAEPHQHRFAVDNVRRLLAASFIFLSLFLIVRTLFLEPFGVPTGSMATTFLGNHREGPCPRCGFRVVVGEPQDNDPSQLRNLCCPNCGQRGIDLSQAAELPGDRLLVDKNIFSLRSPRRWEVAVFRCPVDFSKPYVKRVVGLPGEAVLVKFGDVYANGELQRKTHAQCRECRILEFDSNFAPKESWNLRWLITKDKISKPADGDTLDGGVLSLNAEHGEVGASYRNFQLDSQQAEPITDALAYNGLLSVGRQAVHDFTATFELEILSGDGSFAAELFDGLDSVYLELGIQGGKPSRFGIKGADHFPLDFQLAAGKKHKLELIFTDRRFSAAVNGKVIMAALDLPAEKLELRKAVSQPVQFGLRNGTAKIRNFKLYRDVYYRDDVESGRGTKTPWQLGPDEYYMLGDNSNNSKDSRQWSIPGVPEKDFLGKPFLIHQPLKLGKTDWPGPRQYQAIDWDRLRWVR